MQRVSVSVCLCGLTLTGLLIVSSRVSGARNGAPSPAAPNSAAGSGDHRSPPRDTLKPPRPHPVDEEPVKPPTQPEHPPTAPTPKTPTTTDPPSPSPPSPDREAVRKGAHQFRGMVQQGRVRLQNDDRERAQIEGLCLEGVFRWPQPPALKRDRAAGDQPLPRPTGASAGSAFGFVAAIVGAVSDQQSGVTGSPPQAADVAATGPTRESITNVMPQAYVTGPPIELFTMLNALATHSTEQRPLTIMSLLRAPYKTARYSKQSAGNPHALGLAADIGAFGGHTFSTEQPEEELQACLAILKALPAGRYRMGFPKAPLPIRAPDTVLPTPDDLSGDVPRSESSPGDGGRSRSLTPLPSRGAGRQETRKSPIAPEGVQKQDPQAESAPSAPVWPFFPAPQKSVDAHGKAVTLFANERYANEQYLSDERLRKALADARKRGVDVFAVFPDGVNHLHIDVRQVP